MFLQINHRSPDPKRKLAEAFTQHCCNHAVFWRLVKIFGTVCGHRALAICGQPEKRLSGDLIPTRQHRLLTFYQHEDRPNQSYCLILLWVSVIVTILVMSLKIVRIHSAGTCHFVGCSSGWLWNSKQEEQKDLFWGALFQVLLLVPSFLLFRPSWATLVLFPVCDILG